MMNSDEIYETVSFDGMNEQSKKGPQSIWNSNNKTVKILKEMSVKLGLRVCEALLGSLTNHKVFMWVWYS